MSSRFNTLFIIIIPCVLPHSLQNPLPQVMGEELYLSTVARRLHLHTSRLQGTLQCQQDRCQGVHLYKQDRHSQARRDTLC